VRHWDSKSLQPSWILLLRLLISLKFLSLHFLNAIYKSRKGQQLTNLKLIQQLYCLSYFLLWINFGITICSFAFQMMASIMNMDCNFVTFHTNMSSWSIAGFYIFSSIKIWCLPSYSSTICLMELSSYHSNNLDYWQ
jgi:hypothetical protein